MILLLGGTSDGTDLAVQLEQAGFSVVVSVATDYGYQLTKEKVSHVIEGRMDEQAMCQYVLDNQVTLLIDGTHPFATIASKTAMAACQKTAIPYIRFERPSSTLDNTIPVDSIDEACEVAKKTSGRIYLTTGSKTLGEFASRLPIDRLVARVLPTVQVITSVENLGFQAHQIQGMRGPFSKDLNKELIKKEQASVMITKESGPAGGLKEKIEACQELNIPCIVIKREKIEYPLIFQQTSDVVAYCGGL